MNKKGRKPLPDGERIVIVQVPVKQYVVETLGTEAAKQAAATKLTELANEKIVAQDHEAAAH